MEDNIVKLKAYLLLLLLFAPRLRYMKDVITSRRHTEYIMNAVDRLILRCTQREISNFVKKATIRSSLIDISETNYPGKYWDLRRKRLLSNSRFMKIT